MTTVVLVGPTDVRGPGAVEPGAAAEALSCLDDEFALVHEQVVRVDDLWTDVLRAAAGPSAGRVVAVVPSWWSPRRVARIEEAGRRAGLRCALRQRSEALWCSDTHVVEAAVDLVAVHAPDRSTVLVPRTGSPSHLVDDVCEHLVDAEAVLVDDPVGSVGEEVAHRLRMRRVDVTVVDDEAVRRACRSRRRTLMPQLGSRGAVAAAASLVVAVLCGAAVWHGPRRDAPPPTTWLVEGRVTVEVAADWIAERILDGPGSARVQIVSPTGQVMHLTQSAVPEGQARAAAAEVVRTALAAQPEGVFVEFEPAADVAGVAAMTYRETRSGRRVDWTLVLDGGVRIAIGCQETDTVPAPIEDCHRAVRTAREIRSRAMEPIRYPLRPNQ